MSGTKPIVLQSSNGTAGEVTKRVANLYGSLIDRMKEHGHDVVVAAGVETFDHEEGAYSSYYTTERVSGLVVCRQVVETLQPGVIRDYTAKLRQNSVPQLNAAEVVAITETKERKAEVIGDIMVPLSARLQPLHDVEGIIPADEKSGEALKAMGEDAELRCYTFGNASTTVVRAVARSKRVVDGKEQVKWAHLADGMPDNAAHLAQTVQDRIRHTSGVNEIHTAIDMGFDGDQFRVIDVMGQNPAFPRAGEYPDFTNQLRDDLIDQLVRMSA